MTIELKNLSKVYDSPNQKSDDKALDEINLTIPKGKIFGILGKSGAGKSTLLRCVNFLEKPTTGKVLINQVDLSTLSVEALREQRRKIGMIFQHFNLLNSRNVFDNIALPLEIAGYPQEEIKNKVNELLELVDLTHKKNDYPNQLSGGQKQRTAIARALATQPEILLSDEATSSLDTETTKSILDLLKKINQELNVTILLITHELDVIKQICTQAAVLEKGKIAELANTVDLLIHPQTSATKRLVKKNLDVSIIDKIHAGKSLILQLTFIGKDSDIPLISTLVKNYNVTINILQAQIEHIQEASVGYTICELTGDKKNLEEALAYIKSTSIITEVLNHE